MNYRTRAIALGLLILMAVATVLVTSIPDSGRTAAQVATPVPCPTEPQIAPTFATGNEPTALPQPTATPCASVTTPRPTATPTANPNEIFTTPTPQVGARSVSAARAAGTVIGQTFAIVVDGDAAGFIEAINYSNALTSSAPYQIYLRGTNYNLTSLQIPPISRSIAIYGNNSLITVTALNRFRFLTNTSNILTHVRITNGGNNLGREYGGAISNLGDLTIRDSEFFTNAALNGGGAIMSFGAGRALSLQRVYFTNNRAGGGAAIQIERQGSLSGECLRFEGNNGYFDPVTNYSGYGASILTGSDGATVNLRNSAFRSRNGTGRGRYAQLFRLVGPSFSYTVNSSYFATGSGGSGFSAVAAVPINDFASQVTPNVSVINPVGSDPTLSAGCAFQPPPTPPQVQQTPTPTPVQCLFATTARQTNLYRAPIPGNPYEGTIPATPNLTSDGYFVDAILNVLWLRVQNSTQPIPGEMRWVPVEPSATTMVNGVTLTNPPQPYINGGSLTLAPMVVSACTSDPTQNSQSRYMLPVPEVVAWGAPLTPFNTIPVSDAKFCQGFERNGTHVIDGLGFSTLPNAEDLYNGLHPGVDFYAPVDSVVYSIGNGRIVAIGKDFRLSQRNITYTSSGNWGGSDLASTYNSGRGGYNVVIRYGQFYVLYGHLKELDLDIYVGKAVSAGTLLGKLATSSDPNAEPHTHVELRLLNGTVTESGTSVSGSQLIEDRNTNYNSWGILKLGGSQPTNVIDVTQFFDPTGSQVLVSDAQSTRTGPIAGLGTIVTPVGNNVGQVTITGLTCPPVVYNTLATGLQTTPTSTYRGFQIGTGSAARHPVTKPIIIP